MWKNAWHKRLSRWLCISSSSCTTQQHRQSKRHVLCNVTFICGALPGSRLSLCLRISSPFLVFPEAGNTRIQMRKPCDKANSFACPCWACTGICIWPQVAKSHSAHTTATPTAQSAPKQDSQLRSSTNAFTRNKASNESKLGTQSQPAPCVMLPVNFLRTSAAT